MMKWLLATICFSPFVYLWFSDGEYVDTRRQMEVRRHFNSHFASTTIYQKNSYFKRAIDNVTHHHPDDLSRLNLGDIALEMNAMETDYDLPYYWGGSIRNHLKGLDCSGFIHGLLYYTGQSEFHRRFNTRRFYYQLKRSSHYQHLYDASSEVKPTLNELTSALKVGDIIVWPGGIADGKNLPGQIWGHVGIVSTIKGGIPYVTHYVSSDAYNQLDIFPRKEHGLNTLKAIDFISIKQRGLLNVFRQIRQS